MVGGSNGNQYLAIFPSRYEDSKSRVRDPDADARTVFVGNLRSDVKPRRLRSMFREFGPVESVRLRCAARPDPTTPKKVAVIRKNFHESRSNICAYVKFAAAESAERSCGLNGTDIDG